MILPTTLLLALASLASAAATLPSSSGNAHSDLAGRLVARQADSSGCSACLEYSKDVLACVNAPNDVGPQQDCLCATQIFVELNGCLSCVALQNTTEYSELTRQAGVLAGTCLSQGRTNAPPILGPSSKSLAFSIPASSYYFPKTAASSFRLGGTATTSDSRQAVQTSLTAQEGAEKTTAAEQVAKTTAASSAVEGQVKQTASSLVVAPSSSASSPASAAFRSVGSVEALGWIAAVVVGGAAVFVL